MPNPTCVFLPVTVAFFFFVVLFLGVVAACVLTSAPYR